MNRFTITEGREVSVDDIREAIIIDKIVYSDEYIVTLDLCLEWGKRNPQIYTMIRDNNTGKIVAYVNLSPVTDECYKKIKSGEFLDIYLPGEAIVPYDKPGLYNLYFSSIVILPEYQTTNMFFMLFNAVINKFIALADNGFYFKHIIADAVTGKGQKICKVFGMERIKNSKHKSDIFEVIMLPPKFKCPTKTTKTLFNIYSNYNSSH